MAIIKVKESGSKNGSKMAVNGSIKFWAIF